MPDSSLLFAYSPSEFEAWRKTLSEKRPSLHPKNPLEKFYPQRYFSADYSRFKRTFIEHKVPLFLYTSRNEYLRELEGDTVLNPSLRELQFQRLKDAPTAFQDIYMFISGVLGVDARPMVQLSNKMIQAKHGLDGEYSFKKPPGKKQQWR